MYYGKQHMQIIIIKSKRGLEKMFKKLDTSTNQLRLYINEDKTKYCELRTKVTKSEKIKIKVCENKESTFYRVDQLEYLGVTILSKARK